MSFATHLAWLVDHAVVLLFASVSTTVLAELGVRLLRGRGAAVRASATSVVAGVTYIGAKGLVSRVLMFGVAMWVYDHHRLATLDATDPRWWVAIFVARDLVYYWIHRAEHRVNALWASHMVHHSSEEFSFTTAVRMPWMEALYKPALGLWVPLLGFHPAAFAAMGALVLMVGQFQHTELLRRRTWLDAVFVTPSTHRVHHGSNPEYIDKNFGSMLVVWDRLFGTYEPEVSPVRYGLAGDTRVDTPAQALVGGYASLARRMRAVPPAAALRLAVARPT